MTDSLEAARAAFLEGVAQYEAGETEAAVSSFERALQLAPGRVSVLINLGAARMKLGQTEAALSSFDAALASESQHADAWCHRGLALVALSRDDEALGSFERALAIDPSLSEAGYRRAQILNGLQRHADALQTLDSLLQRDAGHGSAWLLHAQTLQMLDRHAESLASYQRAVSARPDLGLAWLLMGQRLAELGKSEDAANAFERSIALGFEVETNRYLLAGLGRGETPTVAPAAYVRALFDSYAGDFESHLLKVLRYRAHEHVATLAISKLDSVAAPNATSALDLGCGTGLCGAQLRKYVARLAGIDLSTTMLDTASRLGIYDELIRAELVEHLRATPHRHELVVCADTFVYIGDLAPAFAGVRRVLQAGGWFVFSIERADDKRGYALTTQLRYAHSEPYVRELAAAHGFTVTDMQPIAVREEQGRAVPGLVVACTVA